MIKNLNTLFVTMFGLGKIPKVPGTFGSLATIIILYIFFHIMHVNLIWIIKKELKLIIKVVLKLISISYIFGANNKNNFKL